jgi:hypothetical protein
VFQPEKTLEAACLIDDRQPGTQLHQQEHRIEGFGPANTDPLCDAAELDCLERIDHHLLSSFRSSPI